MAEFPTKRIINLGEQSAPQSGDYIVTDNQTNGTKKTPASALATSQALTAEATARQQADTALDGKITAEAQARAEAITAEQTAREQADEALTESVTALSDEVTAQGALIQNPTKTVSGSIAHFTDGAEMPAKSVIVNIEPQQSGTGTPSPDNVRQISGWESVNLYKSGKNLLKNDLLVTGSLNGITWTVNADGSVTLNGTATAGTRINITNTLHLKEGEYTLSGGVTGCSIAVQNIGATFSSRPLIISEYYNGQSWLYVNDGTSFNNVTLYPMIRRADEDDTYQPYVGIENAISLGQTVYGARLNVTTGELTVNTEIYAIDGVNKRYTGYRQDTTDFCLAPLPKRGINGTADDPHIISNLFEGVRAGALGIGKCYVVGITTLVSCLPAEITNVEEANAWAQVNKPVYVFDLETPQTYQLTPTEVNTLLGENNVWADAGTVDVTYRRDINLALEQLEALLNS